MQVLTSIAYLLIILLLDIRKLLMNKIYWSVSALKQLKKMDNRYKLLITENVN